MDVKTYLKQTFWINDEINDVLNEKEMLQASLVGSQQLKHDVVTSSRTNSSEDTYLKIMDRNETANELIDKLVDLKINILNGIDSLDEPDDYPYRKLLRLRYCQLKKWEEIAVEMNYTFRHVTRMHGEALAKFEEANKDLLNNVS